MEIVCGIDPGSNKWGIAVIKKKNNKLTLLASALKRFKRKQELPYKLSEIRNTLCKYIKKYKVTHVCYESAFFRPNVKTLIVLARVQGVLIECAYSKKCSVMEISTKEIKKAATGNAAAQKEDVMVSMLKFFKGASFDNTDESDAVATAFCGTKILYENA